MLMITCYRVVYHTHVFIEHVSVHVDAHVIRIHDVDFKRTRRRCKITVFRSYVILLRIKLVQIFMCIYYAVSVCQDQFSLDTMEQKITRMITANCR